ncbi:MAG: TetR/AcrR family transcriptional regulator [Hyphomicrobiales bacterium]|jgi:TetR/AcrR family transcriptional repressor of mexJK operon
MDHVNDDVNKKQTEQFILFLLTIEVLFGIHTNMQNTQFQIEKLRDELDQAACRKPKGRKEAQLLAAAREVFLERGYAGAGMDDIVLKAGISKATAYKYFPDKSLLFQAVIDQVCLEQRDRLKKATFGTETAEALTTAVTMAVKFMLTPLAQSVFRTCVAEAARFPHVGHAFYISASLAMSDQLVAIFERGEAEGCLRVENKRLAANQLWQLSRSLYFYEMLFQVRDRVSSAEVDLVIEETLSAFVARYGTAKLKAQLGQPQPDRS